MPADPSLSRTFSIHPYAVQGGGESRYNPSIYAGPFGQELEAQSGMFEQAREERAQKSFDLQEKRAELEMKAAERADRNEKRRLQREDDIDSALDLIGTKLSNPASMHFQDKYEEIMGDPLVHRAMTGKEGRMAIMGMLKDLHDSHQDYLEGWQKLTSNYGADVSDLSINKSTGEVDWKSSLPVLNQKLQQKHQTELEKKAQGRMEAFKQQAVAKEISPEGEVTGYKVEKGLKPKVVALASLSPEDLSLIHI